MVVGQFAMPTNPVTFAQWLPVKLRVAIYSVLPTLVALELLFDIVDPGVESKLLGMLVILGFGTALSNTAPAINKWGAPPQTPGAKPLVEPHFPDEFA